MSDDLVRDFSAVPTAAQPVAQPLPPDPFVDATPVTALDELRSEIAKEVTPDPVTLEVPLREGWSVRYRADLEASMVLRWQRKAGDKSLPGGVDPVKVSLLILGAQCDAILKGDVECHDPAAGDGALLTFRSPTFVEMTGAIDVLTATRHFYGSDGHILDAAGEVLEAAGFGGGVLEGEDPT